MSDSLSPAHFLLVEDDNAHADLMLMSFGENKVANTITRVADGEQALNYLRGQGEFAEAKRPDVILLDLKIPKIDGHTVLREIKSDPKLPVVVLTTSSNTKDVDQAYENHANSFLTKPFEFGDFQRLVRDLGLYWSVWNRPPVHTQND
jgi:hypothetical protein